MVFDIIFLLYFYSSEHLVGSRTSAVVLCERGNIVLLRFHFFESQSDGESNGTDEYSATDRKNFIVATIAL